MRRVIKIIVIAQLLLVGLSSVAWAGEELEKLKQRVDELERAQKEESRQIGYDNGAYIRTTDGKFSLKANVQMQLRYQYLAVDGGQDTNSFTLRRARVAFSGNALTPDLTYLMRFGFDNNGAGSIVDLFANYKIIEAFQIKGGQFFVPFSRESQTPGFKLSFADRSTESDNFGLARDIGMTLHGAFLENLIEYHIYGFNGNGRAVANSNKAMIVGARLNFNISGKPGFRMADVAYSETPQFAVGTAVVYDPGSDNQAIFNDKLARATADTILLYRGLAVVAEGNYIRNTTANAYNWGFGGQVSYFIISKRLELAARGETTFRENGGALADGNVNSYEGGAVLGYYFYKDRIKLLVDYTHLWNNGAVQGQNDNRVRTQFQLNF